MANDVDALISQLTLEEKAALVTGDGFWHTRAIERLGIPSIVLSDGPHGVRRQPANQENGIGGSYPATCFPPAVGLGSTWDAELVERVGEALGDESNALDVQVLLGPGINIKRSPLCGRNFEYFSEDPLIAGSLGAALIRGIQSKGVGTSLKHYAANSQETDRFRVSADMDERTAREIYLAGFERAVKEASPATLMAAYNRLNGVYATEDHWLLTDVLREEWGFDGLVVSDWGAVNDRDAAVAAGLDLEMPESEAGPTAIVAAVRGGSLDEAALDAAVRNVLRLVLDHAHLKADAGRALAVPDDLVEAHHDLAREVASRAAVLLKNDGEILPLSTEASIAVVGEFARNPRYQGAGSSQIVPTRLDDALTQIRQIAGSGVTFAPGFTLDGSGDAAALRSEAVAVATAAQVVVVFLGLPSVAESEGYDRENIDLPVDQIALLAEVAQANPNVVVVLSNGSAVRVSDWQAGARAVLEGWLLGQGGGRATADILFGIANPSGRLTETIPEKLEDNSAFLVYPGRDGHLPYGDGVFVGYRWYDARELPVSYPFGHGLSYTTFQYSGLSLSMTGEDADLAVHASVTVTNTGTVAGREIVQLYVSAPSAEVRRPLNELRGFRAVPLEPGESREVSFTLGFRDFAYFHPTLKRWYVENGSVDILVGASSRDIRERGSVELRVNEPVAPLDRQSTVAEWMKHPGGQQVLQGLIKQAAAQNPEAAMMFQDQELITMMGSMPLRRIGRFPGIGLDDQALDAIVAQANAAV
ncbi:glycoside hydrolase family 3 C-terminal domain-containing protein [Humibacter ginsenosidimutans]|uniref:Exo-alpha-(1->6)-L-arabinopyranosidase n=1 Tax=Humibacter ginsenosidimutans TaxID=2599293 RepID=A0A5B8M8E6_9MICO|nr:glycoside hydrolase family 3 C-terminal domain-containing protein [Humibacter ginsenosidimutans]QDZ15700.1 beta-glucosidase [Humibacter ginsenosidimutans]